MEEVVDRVFLLNERVVLSPEDMDLARAVRVELREQASGLVPAHTVEERAGQLEDQKSVRAPDAGEQARAAHGRFLHTLRSRSNRSRWIGECERVGCRCRRRGRVSL
jgi:hypothetical protein